MMAESSLARANLITRHGARSVQELAFMSDFAMVQEGTKEVSWTDSLPPSIFCQLFRSWAPGDVQVWFKPTKQNRVPGQSAGRGPPG